MILSQRHPGATPAPRPWLVLAVLCTAVLMLQLDTTIVNIAQVKISTGLHVDLGQIQWILDGYLLTYAALLLGFGRLGDIWGRRQLFIGGLTVFTAASALCGAAPALGGWLGMSGGTALILFRFLQGTAAAAVMPQSLALVNVVFTPEQRGAAMGVWSGTVALGAVLGPILGGLIVTHIAWEWIFLINIPIGLLAILAAIAILPRSDHGPARRHLDWAGTLLSGGGLLALVETLIDAGRGGWTGGAGPAWLAASGVLLALFLAREGRAADPMMPLSLFRARNFWVGNLVAAISVFVMLGSFFVISFYLQAVTGFSPLRAGLTTAPTPLTVMLVAPFAGRLSDRIGPRWLIMTGLALLSAGMLLMRARTDVTTTAQTLLPAFLLMGAGMGMVSAPMTAAAMKDVPRKITGSASGVITTMRSVGQLLGITVLGSILRERAAVHADSRLAHVALDHATRTRLTSLITQGRAAPPSLVPPAQRGMLADLMHHALVAGVHDALIVAALVGLAGFGVALLVRNPRAHRIRASRFGLTWPARLPQLARDDLGDAGPNPGSRARFDVHAASMVPARRPSRSAVPGSVTVGAARVSSGCERSTVHAGQIRTGHPLAPAPGSDLTHNRKGHHVSVQMVQARIKAERVTDVQAAAKKMFAAINAAQPEGIRYASSLLPDGETFVALLQVDDGVDNPLPGFPEFREFLAGVEAARTEPARVQPLTVIGSYRLF